MDMTLSYLTSNGDQHDSKLYNLKRRTVNTFHVKPTDSKHPLGTLTWEIKRSRTETCRVIGFRLQDLEDLGFRVRVYDRRRKSVTTS